MFAYCGNNPINREDPNGYLWGFIKEFVAQVSSAINAIRPAYAVAGGCAIGDGPLPIGDLIGAAIAIVGTVGAIGYAGYRTYKSSTQASTISTSITATADIPIINRKSGSYYPAGVDNSQNTVSVDFSRPMNLANAQQYVRKGGDVYTFAQHNALSLALTTGGSISKLENHVTSPNSRPGVYFNHYHGKGVNGERVHIFFDLPKIKN